MTDPIQRAINAAELSAALRNEYHLAAAESMLAAHLVVAHGWGEQAAAALPTEERKLRHEQLAHDGHHH